MVLSKITKGFIPKLIQEIDREGERGERRRRPSAAGASDKEELGAPLLQWRRGSRGRRGADPAAAMGSDVVALPVGLALTLDR